MRFRIYFLLAIALSSDGLYGQERLDLFSNLDLGIYDVGTRQILLVDSTEEQPREISMRLWYPAEKNEREKLILADYLRYKLPLTDDELASK